MASNQTPDEPEYPKIDPPGGSSKHPPMQHRPVGGERLPINPPGKIHTSVHSDPKKGKREGTCDEQAGYTNQFNPARPDPRVGQLIAPNISQQAPPLEGYYAPTLRTWGIRGQNQRPSKPPTQETTGYSSWPSIPCPCGGKKTIRELKESYENELDRRDAEKACMKADMEKEREEQLQVISTMKSTIQGLRLVIREAQLAGIQQSSQASWTSEDESRLADTLGDLNINVSRWVNKYHGGVLQSLGKDEETEILDSWATVTDLVQHGTPHWLFDPAQPATERIFTVILTALVSRDLFMKTFGNPFFFLAFDAANNDQGEGQSTATKILDKQDTCHMLVDRILRNASPKEAHEWRAQAFRHLFPKAAEAQPGVLDATLSSLELASASLANAFVEGPARHLLRTLDQDMEKSECIKSLKDLYYCAGELSTTMQRCLPEVSVVDPKKLIHQPFSVYERSTEAHRAYGLIDDDDEKLDGKGISLVMNPTIRLWGNDDGEGYETDRVLVKSCVMLDGWADGEAYS
ncbi:hypothetical protein NW755_008608 [Fusarium falciforme]|uniref:Uncharacterized protein n=1 Tax=Fusarium falciforme TaxID=195108 RepID=A0A9W8R545_9HYPO|nr:hypothetical protein NW755_008608 [Fusarium falciforme]KAJ4240297.1 hypothetical protein NW757_012579 [Fusarium falciforme]